MVEVFESERFFPLVGWREPKSPFDEFFTARYGDMRGANSASHFRDVPLPEGWRWVGPWTVDRDHDVDDKGWAYGVNWVTRWPPPRGSHKRGLNATRRRRWTRRRALIGDDVVSGSSRDASANGDDVTLWRGATSGSDVAASATVSSRSIALPLGCGDALAGGAADLALDLRLLHDDTRVSSGSEAESEAGWAFDASFDFRGEEASLLGVVPATAAWPVPAGRLGSAVGKGPWLARCGGKFVAVTAERYPDVASASGVDALQDGVSAWRLVARAPAVLTNALPCALRFAVVRDADGATVARGVAPPGTPTGIFDADPRVPSRLELVPLDARGRPTGACVRAVGLFGDARYDAVRDPRAGGSRVRIPSEALVAPFRENENENAGSGVAAPLRLAVSVDRADPSGAHGRPGAPTPLVVDVRTPLVVANGCPFALAVSSFATGGVGGVVVAPGEHAPAATPEAPPERPGGKKKAPDASGALGSGALTPRELWVGAPGGAATKISL